MKNLNKKQVYFLSAGLLVMSLSFVLSHFITVNDFFDGLFKGIGIGLIIYSLIIQRRLQRKKV